MLGLDQAKCLNTLLFIFLIAPFISQGPSVDCDKRNIHEQRMYPTVEEKKKLWFEYLYWRLFI